MKNSTPIAHSHPRWTDAYLADLPGLPVCLPVCLSVFPTKGRRVMLTPQNEGQQDLPSGSPRVRGAYLFRDHVAWARSRIKHNISRSIAAAPGRLNCTHPVSCGRRVPEGLGGARRNGQDEPPQQPTQRRQLFRPGGRVPVPSSHHMTMPQQRQRRTNLLS